MYKKRHLFLFLFLIFVLFGCNRTEKLSIEVEETFVELLLVQECEYKFDYKTNKEAVVDISCDKMTGYLLCDDVVTFSETDTYTFTLLAKNDKEIIKFGSDFFRIKGNVLKNDTDISLDVWANPPKRKVIKIAIIDIIEDKDPKLTLLLKVKTIIIVISVAVLVLNPFTKDIK